MFRERNGSNHLCLYLPKEITYCLLINRLIVIFWRRYIPFALISFIQRAAEIVYFSENLVDFVVEIGLEFLVLHTVQPLPLILLRYMGSEVGLAGVD